MIFLPPWSLTGNGLIVVAHFPELFIREQGFLAPCQQRAYRGWVGAVMLVDYDTSNAGPYRELLFIPGLFRFGRTLSFSIAKIYVSTDDSVQNGRRNWGIPKEAADFSFVREPDGSRFVHVGRANQSFLSVRVRPWGLRFPMTTRIVPGFRVMQESLTDSSASLLLTRPSASGTARLASLSNLRVDAAFFPDLARIRPRLAVWVDDFRMTFPPTEAR